MTIEEYLLHIQDFVDQLSNVDVKVDEDDIIMITLQGLDMEYKDFKIFIFIRDVFYNVVKSPIIECLSLGEDPIYKDHIFTSVIISDLTILPLSWIISKIS